MHGRTLFNYFLIILKHFCKGWLALESERFLLLLSHAIVCVMFFWLLLLDFLLKFIAKATIYLFVNTCSIF
jgi:hypothetical protein